MVAALLIRLIRPLLVRIVLCLIFLWANGNPIVYAENEEGRLASPGSVAEQASPLVLAPLRLSPQERVALRFLEQGRTAFGREHFARARILFERAIEVAPLQPYGYYFLGRMTFAQGDANQALTFLLKAELLLTQDNVDWLGETTCLQGAIHEDAGDYAAARLHYQRCLEFSPENLRALSALARLPEDDAG
jgi:tetratricopeptide (TPR) repeat protein